MIEITSMVFQGMGQVLTGRRPVTELEGPVGISQHVAEASRSGLWTVLQMMVFQIWMNPTDGKDDSEYKRQYRQSMSFDIEHCHDHGQDYGHYHCLGIPARHETRGFQRCCKSG